MDLEAPSPRPPLLRQSLTLPERRYPPAKEPTKSRGTAQLRSPPKPNPAAADAAIQHGGIAGPKQSKSRNGCITCKKKRIKCDEAKPACGQCEKRNVQCEGYKVHYKWRSFDDTTKQARAAKPKKPRETINQRDTSRSEYVQVSAQPISLDSEELLSWSSPSRSMDTDDARSNNERLPPPEQEEYFCSLERLNSSQFDPQNSLTSSFHSSDLENMGSLPPTPSHSLYANRSSSYFPFTAPCSTPVDVQQAGSELETFYNPLEARSNRFSWNNELRTTMNDDDPLHDELSHDQNSSCIQPTHISQWRLRTSSPAISQNSTSSSQSTDFALIRPPFLDPSSPEMLMLRFDKDTCGILSIKDGPSENPWRTFVRPLAKDSRAVYHAISAMAALHGATTQPQLRITGMAHMTKSISKLSAEMDKMTLNQILASALALCLSEGWDDKISTGVQHLKGVKTVLNNALARRSRNLKLGQLNREEAEPLKFLSNTFVYLDAIARLTSKEEHDSINLDDTVQAVNEPDGTELDPLMGCAITLFPLLGKVGSLIQRVRRSSVNSLKIISEANELREQLLQWEPPDMDSFEQPEDPSSNVRHALQTAEAYRRATLLHLHSAVTELSSEPSYDQAKATLAMLAATPLSSRTMIVQIFPLLVGSCEMVQPDDRQWVSQRWDAMMKRLRIVSVSSCWKVVKEVWRRRDQWVRTQSPRIPQMFSDDAPTGQPHGSYRITNTIQDFSHQSHQGGLTFDPSCSVAPRRNFVRLPRRHTDVSLLSGGIEYTVRGQLHWLGVMSDWNWEIFL